MCKGEAACGGRPGAASWSRLRACRQADQGSPHGNAQQKGLDRRAGLARGIKAGWMGDLSSRAPPQRRLQLPAPPLIAETRASETDLLRGGLGTNHNGALAGHAGSCHGLCGKGGLHDVAVVRPGTEE